MTQQRCLDAGACRTDPDRSNSHGGWSILNTPVISVPLAIVPQVIVDGAHIEIRDDLSADIPEGCRESESSLPGLDGLNDARVQGPASLLEEAPIGHFLGQGMLEGIFQLRGEARLIEELVGLEVHEPTPECLLGQLRDGLKQRKGRVR